MTTLGDLTKLLEQGYLTGEYIYDSSEGSYKFQLKTISPLEEIAAEKDAEALYSRDSLKDTEKNVYVVIETLARSVVSVNGIPLDLAPGAEGADAIAKKRSLLKKFSDKLLIGLWAKYQETKNGTVLDGSKEEAEAIKK